MADVGVVLIAGPTASGKSELALRIAEAIDGVVVNADSMQVYRDLQVLTARPDDAECARVPHRLYGFVAADDAYSVGRYAADALRALGEIKNEGRVAIVVGGTGLYFKALLEGLSPIPPVASVIREHWRNEARRLGAADLHAVLAERDPVMAQRLSPTDPQRIVRALEVLEDTGRSLADWQAVPGTPVIGVDTTCVRLVVNPAREVLYERCDARFDAMIEAGALEEVAKLAALGLPEDLPIMRAVGVPALMDYLAGRQSLPDAADIAKGETRKYAKRQLTWLRRNMIAWKWYKMELSENGLDEIVSFVRKGLVRHSLIP